MESKGIWVLDYALRFADGTDGHLDRSKRGQSGDHRVGDSTTENWGEVGILHDRFRDGPTNSVDSR
jgi:hypothetical protein